VAGIPGSALLAVYRSPGGRAAGQHAPMDAPLAWNIFSAVTAGVAQGLSGFG
jgi:hypothetical protein